MLCPIPIEWEKKIYIYMYEQNKMGGKREGKQKTEENGCCVQLIQRGNNMILHSVPPIG